jgi:L,D-peptidoglycan transpeptidase YkuD (ErfK/YbiS/YcfS/YnhG family)
MKTDNKIYVKILKNNFAVLTYPDFNIETRAYIGKNGYTYDKKEGDGKTPIGEFELGIMLGLHDKSEINTKLDYTQITDDLYWVDDPKSIFYNKLVNSTDVIKDWKSAEHLIDYKIQYEYLIEIKTNPNNVLSKGSAIFLHCRNNPYTEGCIAIDCVIMKKITELINKDTKIVIEAQK